VDLIELWNVICRGKWLVFLACALSGSVGAAYALIATEWYRAEVLLIPVKSKPSDALGSQLSGLASIVGVSVAGDDEIEQLAVLESREFARDFIEDHELLPVLYAERWDREKKVWEGSEDGWPDLRDAVTLFDTKVRYVSQDRRTGLVLLAVEWTDPRLVASWATEMTLDLNVRMSKRAMARAEANVAYLRAELAATNVVQLQQPIGRLLELELQKLMLARNSSGYAYRVVDEAQVPRRPVRPRRVLVVVACVVLGGMAALFALIIRSAVASRRSNMIAD
jgi:uncharacterized protein involved in exopolysaccharide biosynthesis